jgi:hypothetical protein
MKPAEAYFRRMQAFLHTISFVVVIAVTWHYLRGRDNETSTRTTCLRNRELGPKEVKRILTAFRHRGHDHRGKETNRPIELIELIS